MNSMNGALSSLREHFRRMRVAYVVLALSLVPATVVYYRVRATVLARERTHFERLAQEKEAALLQRIPRYLVEMLGLRGLFAANATVSSEQWDRYVASLGIQSGHPGLRSLGFLKRVNAGEADGRTMTIRPEGNRPVYFPVVHVSQTEPSAAPELGFDYYANPALRPTMDRARDSGFPQITERLKLPDGNSASHFRPSLVIYLPVYQPGAPPATIENRQGALQGFVFAEFDSERLLGGTSGEEPNDLLDYQIYDGSDMSTDHILRSGERGGSAGEAGTHPLEQTTNFTVLNRTWTIHFRALPAFEGESLRKLPLVALVVWLTLGLLLFGITRVEVKARARAEEMAVVLRKSEAALAIEKERLAVTLYSIADGVVTTDTAGSVLSMNKVAERLTGWPQAETLGQPLSDLFKTYQGDNREPCPSPVAAALATGEIDNREQPVMLITRNGVERIVNHSAAPIRGRDGAIIGAVLVFRDVTARQKSEAELLKESKLESVGLLAGGIAHDFNNILQGILGNISLARMNAHSTEKIMERLVGVEKSAMRAKELTQQLVMFARGGAPIRKQMQANGLIKDATLFVLHGTNAHSEFSLPADSWPVEIDEGQFRQVINNLVLNAVQAMPDGGKIEVRSENVELSVGVLAPMKPGRYVKISIRDFGTGIRPEHLPRIFDPYFSTRSHARGLGLASVHSVVRKHDGQITVDSHVGRGSIFQIYLPVSMKESDTAIIESRQKKLFGQGRILVMDDEEMIRELATEMLRSMGYEVETAREGAEALDRYVAARTAGNPFNVVIMDLTVPEGMGGKEMMRRLRELDPQAKAIVSSGYSLDPVMANFQEYGFSGVIPKPYVMEELARVLTEVINIQSAKGPATNG
jgi:PAS domain S-box-containing protein